MENKNNESLWKMLAISVIVPFQQLIIIKSKTFHMFLEEYLSNITNITVSEPCLLYTCCDIKLLMSYSRQLISSDGKHKKAILVCLFTICYTVHLYMQKVIDTFVNVCFLQNHIAILERLWLKQRLTTTRAQPLCTVRPGILHCIMHC